jgi:hypothetical protein
MSRNMPPSLPLYNMPDICSRNVKTFRKFSGRSSFRVHSSYEDNLVRLQLGKSALFPSGHSFRIEPRTISVSARPAFGIKALPVSITACGSTLPFFIRLIIRVGPKKEVGRVNAGSRIAIVADQDSNRVNPGAHKKSDTARSVRPLFYRKLTVPLGRLVPQPRPTLVRICPRCQGTKTSTISIRHDRDFLGRTHSRLSVYDTLKGQA